MSEKKAEGPIEGLRDHFTRYQKWGLAIIPFEKNTKEPLKGKGWTQYQNQRPNEEELTEWWDEYWTKGANIGLVCGGVSGNVVALDFDEDKAWEDFCEGFKQRHGKPVDHMTPVVESPRGHHAYFITAKAVDSGKFPGGEIRGNRIVIAAPPSVRPEGVYKFVNHIETIMKIDCLEDVGMTTPRPKAVATVDAVDAQLTDIINLLSPYWKEGQKHNLTLYLAGYLATLRWPQPMVLNVVSGLSEEGDSIKNWQGAIRDTFVKVRDGQPVEGYQGLEQLLIKADLDSLETMAKAIVIPRSLRRIDEIRLLPKEKMVGFQKKRRIGELVVEELAEHGHLLRTPGDELFYHLNGAVDPLDSERFKALLERKFGLNTTEADARFALAHVETAARLDGEFVRVYRFAYFDRGNGCLYIDCGDNLTLKLNGKRIEEVENGTDGVYFTREKWQLPMRPDLKKPLSPWPYLIDDLNFEAGDKVALSPEQQREVARLWILGLFYTEELPTKPVVVISGDPGSGKSFFMRRLIRFIHGAGDVDTLGEKDAFNAQLSANHLLALDDVEYKEFPRWASSAIRTASTGMDISLRKLYTTNTVITFTPRCFIGMTSINPPVDGAFVDRMVILRLERLKESITESTMLREVKEKRNKMWGGLVNELNELIPKVLEEPGRSTFRMADWATLGERILGAEAMAPLLAGLTTLQGAAWLDTSPLPAILDEWTGGRGEWLHISVLYKRWKELADNKRLLFDFKSARGLAQHIAGVKHILAREYGMEAQKMGGKGTFKYRFPLFTELHSRINRNKSLFPESITNVVGEKNNSCKTLNRSRRFGYENEETEADGVENSPANYANPAQAEGEDKPDDPEVAEFLKELEKTSWEEE